MVRRDRIPHQPKRAMPTLRNSSPSAIPTELFQYILQDLPQYGLLNMCMLSRALHKEGVRVLYRHIDLSHCTVDQVISWNSHTTNRPDLARLVCALTLPWELTCGEHEHHAIFNHRDPIGDLTALESMDNLKSLFIVCPSRKHGPIIYRWPRTVHLMGGTFRLKTFRCLDWRKVRMNTLAPFLLKQSQIRDLEIGQQSFEISSSPANLPIANLLPHLSVLSTSYNSRSCTILMSCHLRRLKLEMPHAGLIHVTSAFGMLEMAPASVTLTHLHLDFSPGSQIREDDHAEVLMNISKALPNLRFLRYSDPNAFNVSIYSATLPF